MSHLGARRRIGGAVIAALSLTGFVSVAHAADPVVFSFATVGDSRTDPAAPDPTTLLGGDNGIELQQDKLWVQNTKAFSRILRTMQTQKPNLLFFNGDMIYGYGRAGVPNHWGSNAPTVPQVVGSDLVSHYTQYAYWRGMVSHMFETNTYVIPVPGNHETQCSASATFDAAATAYQQNPDGSFVLDSNGKKIPTGWLNSTDGSSNCSTGNGGKNAYVENEQAFVANMGDLIDDLTANLRFSSVSGVTASNVSGTTAATAPQIGTNGGHNGATAVAITSDQHDLTYSFDIQPPGGGPLLHFAIINTDPSGADGIPPTAWLTTDFQAAAGRGAAKFFVFGHKPAFTYNYNQDNAPAVAAGGLDATVDKTVTPNAPTARDAFWSLIAHYNASYYAGHEHTVNVAQHADPTGVETNKPWQVIVGSGGSPFDDKMTTCCIEPAQRATTDRYYAWAVVQVHQSGAVTLAVYGFSDSFGTTQQIATATLQ